MLKQLAPSPLVNSISDGSFLAFHFNSVSFSWYKRPNDKFFLWEQVKGTSGMWMKRSSVVWFLSTIIFEVHCAPKCCTSLSLSAEIDLLDWTALQWTESSAAGLENGTERNGTKKNGIFGRFRSRTGTKDTKARNETEQKGTEKCQIILFRSGIIHVYTITIIDTYVGTNYVPKLLWLLANVCSVIKK